MVQFSLRKPGSHTRYVRGNVQCACVTHTTVSQQRLAAGRAQHLGVAVGAHVAGVWLYGL